MTELNTIKFYGSSDDNFVWKSPGLTDELSCYERVAVVRVLDGNGDSCLVTGQYAPNDHAATWSIGVAPFDEDVPLPLWDFNLSAEKYTTVLSVTGPGLTVQQWNESLKVWE